MRSSLLRDRLCGIELIGEDLPYRGEPRRSRPQGERLARDPRRTRHLRPGPVGDRRSSLLHALAGQAPEGRRCGRGDRGSRAAFGAIPIAQDQVPATEHVMGGMPMGTDARTSVTDEQGRHHHLDNLCVADGGVFPTSGGHNPTLTIMATALRQATGWAVT